MQKWFQYKAHWAVRTLAMLNIVLTALFGRFEHYLINQVTGNPKIPGALLVLWLELCPVGLLIFVMVGLAQLGQRKPPEAQFRKEQLSLYVDGLLALAALLLSGAQPRHFVQM